MTTQSRMSGLMIGSRGCSPRQTWRWRSDCLGRGDCGWCCSLPNSRRRRTRIVERKHAVTTLQAVHKDDGEQVDASVVDQGGWRTFWSLVDTSAWLGAVGTAVGFLITQEIALIGGPLVLPLIALYASRRRTQMDSRASSLETRQQVLSALRRMAALSEESASDIVEELEALVEVIEAERKYPDVLSKKLEERLGTLESTISSLSTSTVATVKDALASSPSVTDRELARTLGTLRRGVVEDLKQVTGDQVSAVKRLDARIAALEGAVSGLELAQSEGIRRMGSTLSAALSDSEDAIVSAIRSEVRRSLEPMRSVPPLLPNVSVSPMGGFQAFGGTMLSGQGSPGIMPSGQSYEQSNGGTREWSEDKMREIVSELLESRPDVRDEAWYKEMMEAISAPTSIAADQWNQLGRRLMRLSDEILSTQKDVLAERQDLNGKISEGSEVVEELGHMRQQMSELTAMIRALNNGKETFRSSSERSDEAMVPLLEDVEVSLRALRQEIRAEIDLARVDATAPVSNVSWLTQLDNKVESFVGRSMKAIEEARALVKIPMKPSSEKAEVEVVELAKQAEARDNSTDEDASLSTFAPKSKAYADDESLSNARLDDVLARLDLLIGGFADFVDRIERGNSNAPATLFGGNGGERGNAVSPAGSASSLQSFVPADNDAMNKDASAVSAPSVPSVSEQRYVEGMEFDAAGEAKQKEDTRVDYDDGGFSDQVKNSNHDGLETVTADTIDEHDSVSDVQDDESSRIPIRTWLSNESDGSDEEVSNGSSTVDYHDGDNTSRTVELDFESVPESSDATETEKSKRSGELLLDVQSTSTRGFKEDAASFPPGSSAPLTSSSSSDESMRSSESEKGRATPYYEQSEQEEFDGPMDGALSLANSGLMEEESGGVGGNVADDDKASLFDDVPETGVDSVDRTQGEGLFLRGNKNSIDLEERYSKALGFLKRGRQAVDEDVEMADALLMKSAAMFQSIIDADSLNIRAMGNLGNALMARGRLRADFAWEVKAMSEERLRDVEKGGNEAAGAVEQEFEDAVLLSKRLLEAEIVDEDGESDRRMMGTEDEVEETWLGLIASAEDLLILSGRWYSRALQTDPTQSKAFLNWGRAICCRADIARDMGELSSAESLFMNAAVKFGAALEIELGGEDGVEEFVSVLVDNALAFPDGQQRRYAPSDMDVERVLDSVMDEDIVRLLLSLKGSSMLSAASCLFKNETERATSPDDVVDMTDQAERLLIAAVEYCARLNIDIDPKLYDKVEMCRSIMTRM